MLWAEFSPLSKSQGSIMLPLLFVVSLVARPRRTTQGSRVVHTPVHLSVCLSIPPSLHPMSFEHLYCHRPVLDPKKNV